jgi:4-amino-4-deoxy-L-arabinose transferase-like glycosyltransferase
MVDQTSSLKGYDSVRPARPSASFRRVSFNRWTVTTHRITALLFIVVWYAIGLRWIWLYRRGNLFDTDEAGYLTMAVAAARNDHFFESVRIVWRTSLSPTTPGITAAIFSLFGIHLVLGFLVPLTAAALTLFLIFLTGLRIGGPRMAWTALVLVATMPVFVDYSRQFHFAMGSTLATMAALYCLLRSDGMASRGSAMLFGFCVGLMPLTRTMAIAYVPGILLAALISSLGRENSLQRLARLALATILAAATTGLWLVPNRKGVSDYLFEYGYGGHSTEYGKASLLDWHSWLGTLGYYVGDAYLIHSAILLVGVTLTAVFAVRRSRGLEPMEVVWKVAHSALVGPAVLFAFGTVALASTPNHGTGFDVPLLSALTLVSVWGLTGANKYLWHGALFVLTVAVLIAYIPKVDLRSPVAEFRVVDIPGIGPSTITDGRGLLQWYEAIGIATVLPDWESWLAHARVAPRPEPIDAATTREWQKVIAQTVEFIRREDQSSMPVVFGFRHRLYNPSSLQLAQFSKYNYGIVWGDNIDPTSLGKSEDAYFRWLTDGGASRSCLLFTSAGIVNEDRPVTGSEALTSAARRAEFLSFAQWTLPDGRDVVAWRRDSDLCRKK